MEQVKHSQAFLRKWKMMLVLPLMVIPFLTMAFWALGGGQVKQGDTLAKKKGLNLNLPDPDLKEHKLEDKLSFYEKAEKDSLKRDAYIRNDPYYNLGFDTSTSFTSELEQLTQSTASKYNHRLNTSPYDLQGIPPEQEIMQKLAQLNQQLQNRSPESTHIPLEKNQGDDFSKDVKKLEDMMQVMNDSGGEDPEMAKLNSTLEKIIDIQHPQRVADKLRSESLQQKQAVFAVSKQHAVNHVGLLGNVSETVTRSSDFFERGGNSEDNAEDNAIEAVVHGNQVLVDGAVIKLRLSTDVYVNGTLVPRDNFVFGVVALNGERLEVDINMIRNKSSLFPVRLEVYDMDGLPGIYVPGAITRDVVKQSADNGLQLMELTSVDPSLKAQATSAGISTIKNILSRKVKQVKVRVKSGYKLYLKDLNIQQ